MFPASGTGEFFAKSAKIIRFARKGCANRPFFHIVVTERRRSQEMQVIEQVGSYDPMPNEHNEKLVGLNLERIRFWIGNGAHLSTPVAQLLGISGFYPVHPSTYMAAWRNRIAVKEQLEKAQAKEKEPQQQEAAEAKA